MAELRRKAEEGADAKLQMHESHIRDYATRGMMLASEVKQGRWTMKEREIVDACIKYLSEVDQAIQSAYSGGFVPVREKTPSPEELELYYRLNRPDDPVQIREAMPRIAKERHEIPPDYTFDVIQRMGIPEHVKNHIMEYASKGHIVAAMNQRTDNWYRDIDANAIAKRRRLAARAEERADANARDDCSRFGPEGSGPGCNGMGGKKSKKRKSKRRSKKRKSKRRR